MTIKNFYFYLHTVFWTLILANLNTVPQLYTKITYIVLFCCYFVSFWDAEHLSHYKQVIVLNKTEDLTLLGGF